MDVLIAILLGVAGSIIAAEICANGQRISKWLINIAVRRLPPRERRRFQEEWYADNRDFEGTIRKICHAIGCCLGASAVASALSKKRHRTSDDMKKRANKTPTTRTTASVNYSDKRRPRIRLEMHEKTLARLRELQINAEIPYAEYTRLTAKLFANKNNEGQERELARAVTQVLAAFKESPAISIELQETLNSLKDSFNDPLNREK